MALETLEKEDIESFANPEKKLPETDCLVVMGRGVERVETSEGEKWKLSRYVQAIDEKRPGRFLLKTERIKGEVLAGDQSEMIISGGTAVVLGAVQYLEEVARKPLVIMAGGRPEYLKEAPEGIGEGSVMKGELLRHVQAAEVIASPDNDTYEGVLHSLQEAKTRGYDSIIFSTIELHMPRVQEFHKYVTEEHPEFKDIVATFVTSEDLLRRRYAENPARLANFEHIQRELHESEVWRITKEREERGIRKLRSGDYWAERNKPN